MNFILQCGRISLGNIIVKEEQARIVIQVQPNARQNEVICFRNGALHVRIAAPPINGKANQELIKFLSDILGVSKNKLTIEKGMTSKRKVLAISELTQNKIMEQLERLGIEEEDAPVDGTSFSAPYKD
jgi:uncharacterized protein